MPDDSAKVAKQLADMADLNKQIVHHLAMQTHHLAQIEAVLKEMRDGRKPPDNPRLAVIRGMSRR